MAFPDAQLDKIIAERQMVSVCRANIDNTAIRVMPIAYSSNLVLTHHILDLRPNGELVFRRSDLTGLSQSHRKTDAFQTRLLKSQGLIDDVQFDVRWPLSDWRSFLESVNPKTILSIECEADDPSELWIGRVAGFDADFVKLHDVSGAGTWSDEPVWIDLEAITCCQLNSSYIKPYETHFKS